MKISPKSIIKKTLLAQALYLCLSTPTCIAYSVYYEIPEGVTETKIGNFTYGTIYIGGTLKGTAIYNLDYNIDGTLCNEGTLSPGNDGIGDIVVYGNYKQVDGNLELEFSEDDHDNLVIYGNAHIYGTVTIKVLTNGAPLTAAERTLRLSDLIQVTGNGEYRFTLVHVIEVDDPNYYVETHTYADVNDLTLNYFTYQIIRRSTLSAYYRYASNRNASSIAYALSDSANSATGNLQKVYDDINNSNPDGSEVSYYLNKLLPTQIFSSVNSTFDNQHYINNSTFAFQKLS